MSEPLVSVVIPCYQQGRYLQQTIESVLAQTYGRIEIVVVDDGSTDNTDAVAAGHSNRVVYFWQPNQGLSAARNAGIRLSKGEWIQLLDADDLLEPRKIEQQVLAGTERSADVVWGPYGIFTDSDPKVRRADADYLMDERDAFRSFAERWERGFSIPIHAMLFRRSCFERWGDFDRRLRNHEDWDCHLRFSAGGAAYSFTESDRALYRHRDASMSRGADAEEAMRRGKYQCIEQLMCGAAMSSRQRTVLRQRYVRDRKSEVLDCLRRRKWKEALRRCRSISVGTKLLNFELARCWLETVARVARGCASEAARRPCSPAGSVQGTVSGHGRAGGVVDSK